MCLECLEGFYLNEDKKCEQIKEQMVNCKNFMPGSGYKCAICKEGYYREQSRC